MTHAGLTQFGEPASAEPFGDYAAIGDVTRELLRSVVFTREGDRASSRRVPRSARAVESGWKATAGIRIEVLFHVPADGARPGRTQPTSAAPAMRPTSAASASAAGGLNVSRR